jgi:hypothetical protein
MEYTLTGSDVGNARDADGKVTRASVQNWLDTHAGDFSEVTDFYASIEDGDGTTEVPWASEESELTYNDAVYADEE